MAKQINTRTNKRINKIIFTNPGAHHIIGKPINQVRDNYKLWPGELEKHFNVVDWNVVIARQVHKRLKDKRIKLECWFYDKHLKQPKTMSDGKITYRFFPCSLFFNRRSYSKLFVQALDDEIQKNNVLIHLNDYRSYQSYLILNKFGGKVPIVAQYHGLGPALDLVKYKKQYLFAYPLLFAEQAFEKPLLKKIDCFLTTQYEKDCLTKFIEPKKILVLPTPADFDLFRPENRERVRQNLRKKRVIVPKNSKLILYIGRFFRLKRADLMIRLFRELKKKDKAVEVMMIGGRKDDDLYNEVKKSGIIAVDAVPHDSLPVYFNAANVFVYYASESMKKHAGMGVAPAEALACNIPIVSTNIQNVPKSIIPKLGLKPKTEKQFIRDVQYVLNHQSQFKSCRKIAYKYFSYDSVYSNYLRVYANLFKKYYR